MGAFEESLSFAQSKFFLSELGDCCIPVSAFLDDPSTAMQGPLKVGITCVFLIPYSDVLTSGDLLALKDRPSQG